MNKKKKHKHEWDKGHVIFMSDTNDCKAFKQEAKMCWLCEELKLK